MGEVDPVSVYEHLLEDEDLKDVTIEFSDGSLRVHACILSAASEAVKGILRNGTARESRTLAWKEHELKVGRFFTRLLYTGCVEERDWTDDAPPAATTLGAASSASCDRGGMPANASECHKPEPANATSPVVTVTPSGRQNQAQQPLTIQEGIRVRVLRDTNALVMGSYRFIQAGTVGTVSGGGKSVVWPSTLGAVPIDSLKGNLEPVDPKPPLGLLTGAIGIAKVYQFPSMLGALTASIKKRLSVQTFDEICKAAIRDDIQVLRYHCMRFADSESKEARELRELYTDSRLSPEVTHELDGLWRQESSRPLRRRRML